MTGKERFIAALRRKPVDRVPLFEQSFASSVASELFGRPMLTGTTDLHHDQAEAQLRGPKAYEEFLERVLDDSIALARRLGHSAVSVPWLAPGEPTRKLGDVDYLYGDPDAGEPWCVRRFDPVSRTFGVVRTGGEPQTEDEIARALDEREAALADPACGRGDWPLHQRLMEKVGDEMAVPGGGGIAVPLNETWLTLVALRPDLVERHLDLGVEGVTRMLEAQAEAGIETIWGGYDLANNAGPVYGPRVFREMVVPRIRRITDRCRELGLVYLFRTDGKLWDIADDFFIATGIDAYGEIDVDAGMDPVEIRRRYPDVALWGGLSCGKLLRLGTPEQVRAETRRVLDGVGPTGLVLGSSNSILHGTPVANVLAMVEEASR